MSESSETVTEFLVYRFLAPIFMDIRSYLGNSRRGFVVGCLCSLLQCLWLRFNFVRLSATLRETFTTVVWNLQNILQWRWNHYHTNNFTRWQHPAVWRERGFLCLAPAVATVTFNIIVAVVTIKSSKRLQSRTWSYTNTGVGLIRPTCKIVKMSNF